MVIKTWILSLLAGIAGATFLLCLPLGYLTFYGLYTTNDFSIRKMEKSVILFFPLSCLLIMALGRFLVG